MRLCPCRRRRGDSVRHPSTAGLFGRADRRQRHLQGCARIGTMPQPQQQQDAMVSFMHHWALQAFVEAAAVLGRDEHATHYAAIAKRVKAACEATALGWAVVSTPLHQERTQDRLARVRGGQDLPQRSELGGAAPASHRRSGRSRRWTPGRISILPIAYTCVTRPTTQPDDEIGYVTRVYKGIKENAAIFSHPNPVGDHRRNHVGRGDRR